MLLTIENLWRHRGLPDIPKPVSLVLTLILVNFGWILFRFEDFGVLGTAIRGFFGLSGNGFSSMAVSLTFRNNLFFLIVSVLACTPFAVYLGKFLRVILRGRRVSPQIEFGVKAAVAALLLILSFIALTASSYQPFLYNQF